MHISFSYNRIVISDTLNIKSAIKLEQRLMSQIDNWIYNALT